MVNKTKSGNVDFLKKKIKVVFININIKGRENSLLEIRFFLMTGDKFLGRFIYSIYKFFGF